MHIMGSGQPQDTKHNATHATKIITSSGCHLPHKWPFVSTHSLRGMHSISQNLVYCATQQHQKPPIHRHYIPQVGDVSPPKWSLINYKSWRRLFPRCHAMRKLQSFCHRRRTQNLSHIDHLLHGRHLLRSLGTNPDLQTHIISEAEERRGPRCLAMTCNIFWEDSTFHITLKHLWESTRINLHSKLTR